MLNRYRRIFGQALRLKKCTASSKNSQKYSVFKTANIIVFVTMRSNTAKCNFDSKQTKFDTRMMAFKSEQLEAVIGRM